MGIFVIFLLGKLETWFCFQTPCFLAWGITWDYFQTPEICLGGQLAISASQISAIWDKFITFVLKVVETCFWCLFQVFWHGKLIGTILRHQKAILSNQNKIAKFVTLNLNMLEIWFWCLFPIFWEWEIHWNHWGSDLSKLEISERSELSKLRGFSAPTFQKLRGPLLALPARS